MAQIGTVIWRLPYLIHLSPLVDYQYQTESAGTLNIKGKGKVHPCTGTEALYRPYGP